MCPRRGFVPMRGHVYYRAMVSQPPILRIEGVTKAFTAGESFRAVDRLSFTVGRGSCLGFIGPNGAGKTTTLRMVATLLNPDEGEIWVCGHNTIDDPRAVRAVTGYMPDDVGMYEGVRVWEYLEFFGGCYRLTGARLQSVMRDIMELTDLGAVSEKFITTLSKGMRQRLVLAKTLLHDPQLLVLDEPAAGLDPRARIELRMLIKELQKLGKTIIISSHILTELADICDSVAIIEQGRLIAAGKVDDMLALRTDGIRLKIRVLGDIERGANLLRAIDRCHGVVVEGPTISFGFAGTEVDIPGILRALLDQGVMVVAVSQESRNLEDIFLNVTRGAVA